MTEPMIVNVKPLPDIVIEECFVLALTPEAEHLCTWAGAVDIAAERQYRAELALLESLSATI